MVTESRFLGPVERALYLGALPFLAELEPDELDIVAAHTVERCFAPGETVFARGEPARWAYLVVDGCLRVSGGGHRDRPVGPREGVGMLSLLAQAPEGLDAVATEETLALGFDAETLSELFEDNFALLLHQMRGIAAQGLALRKRAQDGMLLAPGSEPVHCPDRSFDLVERIILLRSGGLFASASLDALADLAALMEEHRWKEGDHLWRSGEASGHVVLLLNGTVRASLAGSARVFDCGTGYPLGNLESICGEPRWYDAIAQTPVIGLRGEIDGLLDVLEDHFPMAMDFLAALATDLLRRKEKELARGQG